MTHNLFLHKFEEHHTLTLKGYLFFFFNVSFSEIMDSELQSCGSPESGAENSKERTTFVSFKM